MAIRIPWVVRYHNIDNHKGIERVPPGPLAKERRVPAGLVGGVLTQTLKAVPFRKTAPRAGALVSSACPESFSAACSAIFKI